MDALLITSERPAVAGPPVEVTSYVGRDQQESDARRLLADNRVVTLVGPGGVGKTRLAARIADTFRRSFRNGVAFIELAELREEQLLPNLIAERLGLHDQSARAATDTIVEYLRTQHMLIVLDNCEHLVDACADLVTELIGTCPDLTILATSRQSLGVQGEHLLLVPPLAVPNGQDSVAALSRCASVRLFVDRAASVLPSFELTEENFADIAELSRRLEGLPLAIELAAVRTRSLTPHELLRRLDERLSLLTHGARNAPHRQQTLRSMIEWSYELCSPAEKLVWTRASVFSGTFDLSAAEQVCADSGAEPEVLDLIDGLLDKSMLLREDHDGHVRYRMLETLREFANGRLVDAGEAAGVARRHRDYYVDLTERFARQWQGPEQTSWLEQLTEDHANLRIALDHCAADPEGAVTGLRMATLIDDYWGIRGFHTEARIWLDRALAMAPKEAPERVDGLRMAGWFALLQGDIEVGVAQLTEAQELVARTGDPVSAAYVSHAWGMAALFSGDMPTALNLFTDVGDTFAREGVLRGELFTRFIHGLALGYAERLDECRVMLRANIDRCAALGESFWRSWTLWALSHIEVMHGDVDVALTAGRQALAMQRLVGNRLGAAFSSDVLAWIADRQGDHVRAATGFGIADAINAAIGSSPDYYAMFGPPHHAHIATTKAALGEAKYEAAFAAGRSMPRDQALRYLLNEQDETQPTSSSVASPLTKRESQVAELVAQGMTNREIAAKLVIGERTAETHVQHILTKLGMASRAAVASWHASHHRTTDTNTDVPHPR